ncbi:PREDICTED: uncharacterized protein LOC106794074 [Polistes canadensis]|uniref:uncharacterized protein LOC106794074 n=1 Tax=Polistes canadensis TaxID=91411 RepID=UPI000718C50D|nr:PREDICTED: uncharacterized protein LOC106794074 [Polistes canadensis]XP_014616988.1 PREDICTED: uncharacterized protein LOC106794074 [Polistes canadensis]
MNLSKMDNTENIPKYKWTPESTSLLVSIWSDNQVQKQFEYATKTILIWESVARYMKKKGYNVSAKQCRSRMKQVLICYREAKKAGTRADVEQYYELIDKVTRGKRLENNIDNGIDTVDTAINIKSLPKDVKSSKNLQMRYKCKEPVQSILRTEALSPTWPIGCEFEYPDSPESSETVIARPYGVLSPTKDVAVNTCMQEKSTKSQRISVPIEEPIKECRQNIFSSYPYGDIPYQNSVQNVQNQIIQENMQHNQNFLQNHMYNQMQQQNMFVPGLGFQNNITQERMPHFINDATQTATLPIMNPNILRQHNQLHQIAMTNNRAVPQEPQKIIYGQNIASGTYRRYQNIVPRSTTIDAEQYGSTSPDYLPDVTSNLNVAFCEAENDKKKHNLNETYNRSLQTDNFTQANPEVSVITNNATYNDNSLLLDYSIDSLTPSENDNKSKDTAVNTENMPDVPIRKKKAQKLEQLVVNAINSQNDVVNKILAAQNDMVSKFLNLDRDRQSKLEDRLDHLLNVVHTKVLNKNTNEELENQPSSEEPAIITLCPPPKPGAIPPKLDLVPPKPCRVPCTLPSSNVELVNKNPILTKPGIVSPITSPSKKPGTIWSKLGPVSQSPFVKAQQRLGLQPTFNTEIRTKSSAERRIAKEVGNMKFDIETLITETTTFLEMERQIEEKVENARLQQSMRQSLHARRKLFTQREPTAAMILTAAFLETERQMSEKFTSCLKSANSNKSNFKKVMDNSLLSGQGEHYEYLQHLNQPNVQSCYVPCDTSTPAKVVTNSKYSEELHKVVPKQTIQQLAQLVMNSARWRNLPTQNEQFMEQERKQNVYTAPKMNVQLPSEIKEEKQDVRKGFLYNHNIYSTEPVNEQPNIYKSSLHTEPPSQKPVLPMGFTTTMLNKEIIKDNELVKNTKSIEFLDNIVDRKQQNVRFMDEALAELQRMYIEKNNNELQKTTEISPVFINNDNFNGYNQNMIERYIREIPKKQFGNVKNKEVDSDDDEFLDTTTSMPPVIKRRGSITSTGTTSSEAAHSMKSNKLTPANCIIS